MTPQEQDALTEERDALKLQLELTRAELQSAAPAEAGFSANFHLLHDKAGTMQFTFRGARSGDAEAVMGHAQKFIAHMKTNGWRFNVPQPAPPPAQHKAAEIAAEEGNHELAHNIKQDYERVPDPPQGKTWQTITAARLVIRPEPGDLVTLEFYEPNHKWPDIKASKWKLERATGLLKHTTSAPVNVAADLTLGCVVYYVNGAEKKDKPGEFWKDIYHVRPL